MDDTDICVCWMEAKKLVPGDTMALTGALDLRGNKTLDVVVDVEQADEGEDAVLVLQHAARNVSGGYVDFETRVEIPLNVTGKTWVKIDRYTRFLGWSLEGTLATGATVTTDVVAKR